MARADLFRSAFRLTWRSLASPSSGAVARPQGDNMDTPAERLRITYRAFHEYPRGGGRIPYVLGVMANLSGNTGARIPIDQRDFESVDLAHLDAFIAARAPKLALDLPDVVGGRDLVRLDLTFESLDDFSPAGVIARLPALQEAFGASRRPHPNAITQLALILEHQEFRALVSAWRGLEICSPHPRTRACKSQRP